ncbi:TorD/DmsD family molecular chaperone [Hydrogenophaga soli]
MTDLNLHAQAALDEEVARAELYGLLSHLYYAPPDTELMAQLQVAVTETPVPGGFLQEPWQQLVGVARTLDAAAVADEFDALFGGVGKPEVAPYASHHLAGFLNEKPLAALRADLDRLGLTRDEQMPETEDHVAYVFEVMRYLIAGDDVAVANLTEQRRFFTTHVQTWVPALCEEVGAHPRARFYAALAVLTQAFVSVEAQGFDMLA